MKCVLHIGTEKTATTLLQNWLYHNEAALSAQGVALSQVMNAPNNRKLVTYAQGGIDDYLKMRGIHDEAARQVFFRGFPEAMDAEIRAKAQSGHHTFLITSEHFHSRLQGPQQVARVREILAPYFDEFRIVCYFREQSKKRTSLYSTGLRNTTGQTIEDFQKGVGLKHHAYNYLVFFRKWEDAFGKAALVPRLFDKSTLYNCDVRRDFVAHALPGVDPEALNFDKSSANVSLSADEAQLYQRVNAARPQFIGKVLDPTPGTVKHLLSQMPFLDRSGAVNDPRQQDLYDLFNESNIAFFERYFGEARNLFQRPEAREGEGSDTPKYTSNDLAELADRLMRFKNLVVLREEEVSAVVDMAQRLHDAGAISVEEALTLLSIAQRARPDGEEITARIEALWSQK